MALLAVVIFNAVVLALVWLTGPPKIKPLRTGTTCVEIIDRIFKNRNSHTTTPAEEADMDDCREALRDR
jgi:hypothetical protein